MEKISFPFVIDNFKRETDSTRDLVRVGPKRYVFPVVYKDLASQYYNFELRPDDIFLLGFPRSGTTRCQEAIWLLNNNLDYDKAQSSIIDDRCPLLELETQYSIIMGPEINVDLLEKPLKSLPKATSPRFIKSHMPLSLLPPSLLDTTKVVYMARDPRDVAVSFYKILKLKLFKDIDFEQYWNDFQNGEILLTPIFEHIKEAWEQRNHPNLFFLTYEDMTKDLPATLRQMSEFFGKKYTEDQISGLCKHLSFDNFKSNKSVNGEQTLLKAYGVVIDGANSFIRRGKIGGWEDYFSDELKRNAEQWMAENLAGTDLPFVI
ncbi:sulfotransferase 1E1 [Pieris rapae]|uniref:sulfotransferase 1E1 n=1 Tax=Pieris rapae TaxID=64459 RepID=UPI001E280771|nr:sulfotransferase 1E1 [Pieris rapae]